MLPSIQEFQKQIGAMDINESDDLVVYDQIGIFSSPRVYWTFKVFGHEKIRVLNGGLPRWLREGKSKLSSGEEKFKVRYE
jgi:thiosulfate/3-mercaptopyruvate sulfurtransferase